MVIGIIKEPAFDNRVAMLPETIKALYAMDSPEIWIETGAGKNAGYLDDSYTGAGAKISSRSDILSKADLLLTINSLSPEEISQTPKGQVIIGVLNPLVKHDIAEHLRDNGSTSFSLEMIPRTTRAQSMDILSSMAFIAGYKAVLMAASELPKFFPMFMTAAGSIAPAKVLILGAGVAGLQAIATARRLGAVVHAFDVRSAVKEEVQSLGAKFVDIEGSSEDKSAGGYAVEQSEDYKLLQQKAIHDQAIKSDVIISTAQIPGRQAPVLIYTSTVEEMKPGAVIVDLAASSGGNCELTKNNETVIHNGVSIIGKSDLPSTMAMDASKMYGKNMLNFLKLIIKEGEINLNFEDDIVQGSCITHNGDIINERVKSLLEPIH